MISGDTAHGSNHREFLNSGGGVGYDNNNHDEDDYGEPPMISSPPHEEADMMMQDVTTPANKLYMVGDEDVEPNRYQETTSPQYEVEDIPELQNLKSEDVAYEDAENSPIINYNIEEDSNLYDQFSSYSGESAFSENASDHSKLKSQKQRQ